MPPEHAFQCARSARSFCCLKSSCTAAWMSGCKSGCLTQHDRPPRLPSSFHSTSSPSGSHAPALPCYDDLVPVFLCWWLALNTTPHPYPLTPAMLSSGSLILSLDIVSSSFSDLCRTHRHNTAPSIDLQYWLAPVAYSSSLDSIQSLFVHLPALFRKLHTPGG